MFNCFIRFSAYEVKRLPARFRSIFRLENNTAQGSINRTPNGTIYSATFKRWGYDIFATSSSGITDLKEEFYKSGTRCGRGNTYRNLIGSANAEKRLRVSRCEG